MFVIHGIFQSLPTERLLCNVTQFSITSKSRFIHEKCYDGEIFDLSRTYNLYEKNVTTLNSFPKKIVILPPLIRIAEFYEKFADLLIIRFPFSEPLKPVTPLPFFSKTLQEFKNLRHKTLIELSGECIDFNMNTTTFEFLSYNQAILRCALKGAKTFFAESLYSSYYTYLDERNTPHLVFMEDTKTISQKHNLIKDMKFKGICWKDVSLMADGNWESLKGAYNSITS